MTSTVEIPQEKQREWQEYIDMLASVIEIPAALVMRVVDENIEVFLSSHTENNPYTPGDREYLINSGLYCERVINSRTKLLVPNALTDVEWMNNPDIKLGMTFYLGYPIEQPDGIVFGTLCVLNSEESEVNNAQEKLIIAFKELIENDIAELFTKE